MHKNNSKDKGKRLFFRIYCVKCTEISGINFKAYAKQVLENTVVSLLQGLEEEIDRTIFMENGVKIHLKFAKPMRARYEVIGFDKGWPPSSSDLNPIEKV